MSSDSPLRRSGRIAILAAALLGWFFGGVQISITNLVMRSAAIGLMDRAGTLDLERYNELSIASETLSDEAKSQLDEWNAFPEEVQQKHRDRIYPTMYQRGAHYVVDSIADLVPCLDDIELRMRRGDKP